MVEIKEVSYKDDRLRYFADERNKVQKRYNKLEKAIKPNDLYLSESGQLLGDCGRELSFYNDVIKMLEDDFTSKSEIERLKEVNAGLALALLYECKPTKELLSELEKTVRDKIVKEIFEEITKIVNKYVNDKHYSTGEMLYDFAELEEKYLTE